MAANEITTFVRYCIRSVYTVHFAYGGARVRYGLYHEIRDADAKKFV